MPQLMIRLNTILLSCLALAGAAAQAHAQTLVVTAFDEAYAAVHRKCVVDRFEDETGAKVDIVVASSTTALAQLRANKEAPIYDVVHFAGGQEIPASREGLLSAISESTLGNQDEVYGFATNMLWRGRGPTYLVEVFGLIHNTLNNTADLTSWKALTDPSIAADVILPDIETDGGMSVFLMINKALGGDLDNIAPGLEAVTAMAAGGAKVAKTGLEVEKAFTTGSVHYAAQTPNTAYDLQESSVPVSFNKGTEGTPAKYYTANLVANRPNQTLAIRLIDLTLSRPVQSCFVEALRVAPVNENVSLPPAIAADVPKGPAAVEGLERFDGAQVDANRAQWVKLWRDAWGK